MPTNLAKIGATYKFRARIPQDLLRHYLPKKEVVESLRTKSLSEAKRLLPAIQLKYQQEWANLRAALGTDMTELPLNDVTINYLIACFQHESLGGDEQTRLNGNYSLEEIQDYRERLSEAIVFLRDAAAVGDVDVIRPALDQYLQLKMIKLSGSEADYRRLALAYLRGAIQTNIALLARMQGESVATPAAQSAPGTASSQDAAASPGSWEQGISLHALFEYWLDAVAGRARRTVDDVERRVKQMDELTGNKPADQLTKADFINFRDAMLKKGKAARTVEKDLSFLKAVMAYADSSDKLQANVAAGIKVAQPKVSANAQRELESSDLAILFGSPTYARNERPQGGAGEAAVWLPLLGLYAGARLEELCQLRVDDIGQQGCIDYLRIIDLSDVEKGIETRVKTEESRRNVPLHAKLIEAGFLRYVDAIKSAGHEWLFPELTPDVYQRRGGNWSKWWSRWRTELGVGGRHKCFHAFRHQFKTACRGCDIGEDLHDSLTGHTGGGVGRRYGKFSLKSLHNALDKLQYPDFEFAWEWPADEYARSVSKATRRHPAGVTRKGARATQSDAMAEQSNQSKQSTQKTQKIQPHQRSQNNQQKRAPVLMAGTPIYFDTEFIDLTPGAELISLGAVAPGGQTFYAEIEVLPEHCSAFVREHVLPLLSGPRLTPQAFIEHFSTWLSQFDKPTLLCDAKWDILVVRKLVEVRAQARAGILVLPEPAGRRTKLALLPTLDEAEQACFDAAVQQHFDSDPRQHYALVDAHALNSWHAGHPYAALGGAGGHPGHLFSAKLVFSQPPRESGVVVFLSCNVTVPPRKRLISARVSVPNVRQKCIVRKRLLQFD